MSRLKSFKNIFLDHVMNYEKINNTDGEAKFWLEPQIEMAMNQGLSKKQIHEALSLVQDHYEEITHAWRSHF